MIDKTTIQKTLIQRLEKLPQGHAVEIVTYKRNRGAVFVRHKEGFMIIEHGYNEERFEDVPLSRVEKMLKTLLKREFPRSTKIRLYTLGEFDEAAWRDTRRKVL